MKFEELEQELFKDEEFKKRIEKYNLSHEVASMITEARVISGITQANLAKLVGTKQSGIARAESGTFLPSLSFLEKIALALKTKLVVSFEFITQTKETNVSTGSVSSTFLGTENLNQWPKANYATGLRSNTKSYLVL